MCFDAYQEGYTLYMVKRGVFLAPARFTGIQPLDQNADDVVCSAQDRDQGASEAVVIKKFKSALGKESLAKKILRELKILRQLQHENVVGVRLVYVTCQDDAYDDIYVVSEDMGMNLASILCHKGRLPEEHCEFFLYQILRGLKFVHSADVVHRNLNPENLLVNASCDLKISDFGFAQVPCTDQLFDVCLVTQDARRYWYCSPEALSSWTEPGKPADMWSVGCIFAHMLRGKPIFRGKNAQAQLQLIFDCLDGPEVDILQTIPSAARKKLIASPNPLKTPRSLAERVSTAPRLAVEALQAALCCNPNKRITAERFLGHPYLAAYYLPEDEPERKPLDGADFAFQRKDIDMAAVREELYLECLYYNTT